MSLTWKAIKVLTPRITVLGSSLNQMYRHRYHSTILYTYAPLRFCMNRHGLSRLQFQIWRVPCYETYVPQLRSFRYMRAMTLLDLPIELLTRVLDIATAVHPIPAHVLVLNKFIYGIASPILYKDLYFPSMFAMMRFPSVIWGSDTVWKPRTITVELAGGEVGKGAFRQLLRLFASTPFRRDAMNSTRLELEDLRLCMHSTSGGDSDGDDRSFLALDFVNPQRFRWTGPDPAHHFSIAIVASAVNVLFARFRMWTKLQDLHLSNIAFPRDTNELFPALPTLRKLYLGQATLVPVVPLACLLCDPQMESLIIVRLVDCYVESIWGPRLRRADLERAVVQAHYGKTLVGEDERIGGHYSTILDRIRTVVRCEALTERIIGGDRVERLGVLE
ncbi:hypothetical protein BJV78DRAFT_641968 [Lactifluus subvellereus]|nr:hypothetical protein BJV78DRAFT_641968 [Lactifluus subvellereus]